MKNGNYFVGKIKKGKYFETLQSGMELKIYFICDGKKISDKEKKFPIALFFFVLSQIVLETHIADADAA